VQQTDRNDERAVVPVRHVDVADAPTHQTSEEHHAEADPHHRDENGDNPLWLGIFLATGRAKRHRHHGKYADQLPAPERKLGKSTQCQSRLTGALHHVIAGAHQRAAAEAEDHPEGVVRADMAESQPWDVEVQSGPHQLRGGINTDRHADDSPHRSAQQELAHDLVVVILGIRHVIPGLVMRAIVPIPPYPTLTWINLLRRYTSVTPRCDVAAGWLRDMASHPFGSGSAWGLLQSAALIWISVWMCPDAKVLAHEWPLISNMIAAMRDAVRWNGVRKLSALRYQGE
jgi:hypothetical protein